MSLSALSPVVYQLREGLRSIGFFDMRGWEGVTERSGSSQFSRAGPEVIILMSLAAITFFFIMDVATSGRNLAVSSADAWEKFRGLIAFDDIERGSSLHPMVDVLDALAMAARKWGEYEEEVCLEPSFLPRLRCLKVFTEESGDLT
ncbi:uncharacterized protein [Macrobrachium rosenbergii]|uniref:uncharacterized protein isoform X2 n=1 Tax=Macrobrachium rosenbergii TaxID=79674 RepID=UPI0034D39A76